MRTRAEGRRTGLAVKQVQPRLLQRVLVAGLAALTASATLVVLAAVPASASPSPLLSFALAGATQGGPDTAASGIDPGQVSEVPTPTSAPGLPCLTAGTDVNSTPIPGCGLVTPDVPGSGVARLSVAGRSGASGLSLLSTLPTSNGLVVTFNLYQYGGSNGDGTTMDLAVAPPSSLGPNGGNLGYSAQVGLGLTGMPGGYLGVGFDTFGNYSNPAESGTGCGSAGGSGFSSNTVTVRGPGNASVGYCELTSSGPLTFPLNGTTRGDARRGVRFTLDRSLRTYRVEIDPSGGTNYVQVTAGSLPGFFFDTTGATVTGEPPRVSLVFTGSTGLASDIHEIDNVSVSTLSGTPPVLGLTKTDSAGGPIRAGTDVSYTISPKVGAAAAESLPTTLRVTDRLPAGLTLNGTPTGPQWDCSASNGSNVSCAFAGGAGAIPANTTLNPISVSVHASGSIPTGSLVNTATVVSDDAAVPVRATDTIIVTAAPGTSLATWTEQHPATSTPRRSDAMAAFDPVIGRTVLFGGRPVAGPALADTWTYDGTTWTEEHPTGTPPPRQAGAMAFDPAIGKIVLFGGAGPSGALADTWAYDGARSTWSQQDIAGPSARSAASMAFDAATNTVVLFGGLDSAGGSFGDTWSFDGSRWTELHPAASPPARRSAAMAFDPIGPRLVLFGGSAGGLTSLADTWLFDGATWTEDRPAVSPPARSSLSMAFDPAIGSVVMFGGADATTPAVFLDDTWSFDGASWAEQSPAASPPARAGHVMAFDAVRADLVVFGGDVVGAGPVADTWAFGPVPAVSAGAPTVAAGAGRVALADIPSGVAAPVFPAVLSSPFKNTPFKNTPFKNTPFKNTPFKNTPFKNTPFKNTPFKNTSLPPVTLDRIPLIAPDSWSVELAGTPLAGLPLQSVTLQQTLALSPPPAVTLGQFDLSATPLANLSVAAFLLGTTPLASLGDVCPAVAGQPAPCSRLDPTRSSAVDFELAGDDLTAFYANPPLALPALAHLVDSPMTTSLVNDWAFDQSTVGNIAASDLPASILACPPSPAAGTCDTLAHAEDNGFVRVGATVGLLFGLPVGVVGGFSLADLIPAILPSGDLPVSSLDLAAVERLIPTPPAGSAGLVTYRVDAQATCANLSFTPTLPAGFRLIPGSAQISTNGSALAPANLDPATGIITPAAPPACGGAGAAARVAATFEALPGQTLGTPAVTVKVTASGASQQVSAAPATVVDGQDQAPGSSPPASPALIPPDTLLFEHIPAPGHTDFFSVAQPAKAGSTVTVTLSHIPAGQDYDLSLFGPPGLQLRPLDATAPFKNSPFKNTPFKNTPIGDQTAATGSVTTATPSETSADVPLIAGQTLRSASVQRGNTVESVQYVSLAGDTTPFIVQVSGFNGSSSPEPYLLQAHVEDPPDPLNCQPRNYSAAGSTVPSPSAPLPTTTQALILVNGKRTGDIYGPAGEAAVLAAATKLAGTPVAGQPTAMGSVIPVDSDPAVAAAYRDWDGANCDVSKANGVVGAINALVDRLRVGLRDLRYVVVVGSDEVIPFGRVPDLGALGNEQGYDSAAYRQLDNATSAALRAGFILSDDPYGDFTPSPWLNGELFVPQAAVGRLVETPADITRAVDAFVTLGGRFNPNTALTTGYDFMTPAADLVNAALAAQVPAGKATLVAPPDNPTWSRSDLVNGNASAHIPSLASVANGFLSLNGHYDQHRAESAQAFQGATPDPAITPADLPPNLTNAVLFNMGCHAGLNLADVLVGSPTAEEAASLADWAQTAASRGGLYTANTGFGEGDSAVVAYSERLIAYYAENLNGQMTVGQAHMFAKQHYLALGAPSVYDAKAIEESVLYGLPMFVLGPTGTSAPSVVTPPTPPAPPAPAAAGPAVLPPPPATAVSPAAFTEGPGTHLVAHSDGAGHSFFTVNDEMAQVTPHEPVQPRTELPLPARTDGLGPHGALIEQLTSTDRPGFVPLFDTPVIDQASTTASPAITDADFPSVLASIVHTLTPHGPLDTLVVVPAQFSPGHGERTFGSIQFSVEHSNSDDIDAPAIATVDAAVQGTAAGFTVTTPSTDVTRAVVLFLPKSGNPAGDSWTHVELTNSGNGRWSGAATVAADLTDKPIGQYFVQLLDAAGNVATSSNKAANFVAPVAPPAVNGVHILANNAAPVAVYTASPVSINVTGDAGNPGGAFQVSVDGAAPTNFNGPFTVAADGVHTVDATNTVDGSKARAVITISTAGPAVTITSPADGSTYRFGAPITASFTCASLVGIAANGCTQTAPPPGTALPNTIGTHSLTVTATDTAGRHTQKTSTYTVAKAPLIITAKDKITTYGSPPPNFDATIAGLVNNDTAAVLTGTLKCNTAPPARRTTTPGTYPINCSGVSATSYDITFNPGTLTVNKAPLTVAANTKTMVFGGTIPTFDASITGFVNNESAANLIGTLTCGATPPPTATTPAGTYPINCTGVTSTNYTITFVPATLIVTQAPTKLVANPSVINLKTGQIFFPSVSATLTRLSPTGPLAGQTIRFVAGKTQVCTATTNASGLASCNGLTPGNLANVLTKGFDAFYDGTANFLPSQGHGSLTRGR